MAVWPTDVEGQQPHCLTDLGEPTGEGLLRRASSFFALRRSSSPSSVSKLRHDQLTAMAVATAKVVTAST
jgi:hypothetical protein